ncbi:MetS family NSS transporter small subunit [candidate division WOR-3 bacterium]|nr:MetS family NSS transporter small subunit [candidate division WOR-3 bacterium]
MPVSAWIMFCVGTLILFGGIVYSIVMSFRR